MNKIIITLSPVQRFHKVFVMQDGKMIDQVGFQVNDLPEGINDIVTKYNINNIDLCGSRDYIAKIGEDIMKYNLTNYNNRRLIINYVEG